MGEAVLRSIAETGIAEPPLTVETHGRRFHVERDLQDPVIAMGQLVFFSQFFAIRGLLFE